jgi:hypothetical protein
MPAIATLTTNLGCRFNSSVTSRQALALTIFQGFGDAHPSPTPSGIAALAIQIGEKLSDIGGVQSVATLENACHKGHVARRRRGVFA